MFFLIVPRVVTVMPRNENESGKPLMEELPMTALPAGHARESCALQIGNKLANLPGHMKESVTGSQRSPAFFAPRLAWCDYFFGIRFSV